MLDSIETPTHCALLLRSGKERADVAYPILVVTVDTVSRGCCKRPGIPLPKAAWPLAVRAPTGPAHNPQRADNETGDMF